MEQEREKRQQNKGKERQEQGQGARQMEEERNSDGLQDRGRRIIKWTQGAWQNDMDWRHWRTKPTVMGSGTEKWRKKKYTTREREKAAQPAGQESLVRKDGTGNGTEREGQKREKTEGQQEEKQMSDLIRDGERSSRERGREAERGRGSRTRREK